MRMAPSGKKTANAKPRMRPCATTACWRLGLTWAHTGFTGHGESMSIADDAEKKVLRVEETAARGEQACL